MSTVSPLLLEFLEQKQGVKTRSTDLVRAVHDGADWSIDSTAGVLDSSLRHILLEMTASANLKPMVSAPQPGGLATGAHKQPAQFPDIEPNFATLPSAREGRGLTQSVDSNLLVSSKVTMRRTQDTNRVISQANITHTDQPSDIASKHDAY